MTRHATTAIRLPRLLVLLLLSGCEAAGRYGPVKPAEPPPKADQKPEPPPASVAFLETRERPAFPITFVHSSAKEWPLLPAFWNQHSPQAVVHLGQAPLAMVAALHLADQTEIVKIKVPVGLPDPSSLVPPGNPLTFAKWQLGKRLFFDDMLGSKDERFSCASCHRPETAFTEDARHSFRMLRHTPSLVNCVYNKHQFWDGRVTTLEEVLVRDLNDELEPAENSDLPPPRYRHVWSGVISRLRDDPVYQKKYQADFQRVFGVRHPTQDTVAKCLATYMRTILSGNSLYDRAEQERRRLGAEGLSAAHFAPLLDDAALKALGVDTPKKVAARDLETGYRLFHGKARCSRCHAGATFTDHDFHNTGRSRDQGRFAHMPIGLKEGRYLGAIKTPSLRGLPKTAPYMHDGSLESLSDVVDYYNSRIRRDNHLDQELLQAPGQPVRLGLDKEEVQALVLFLRALDGEPVDPMLTRLPK